MMEMPEWVWMPHPGHFICSDRCKFFLNTKVPGPYIVSTVGEYLPHTATMEDDAKSKGIVLVGDDLDARIREYIDKIGYRDVGYGRKYETKVFIAEIVEDSDQDRRCCPWRVHDYSELEMAGYNTATEAYQGHMRLCREWTDKTAKRASEILNPGSDDYWRRSEGNDC